MCQKKGIYTKKKEEAATSLFPIILDALQKKGIYMIILDSKKNNSFCEKSERNFSEIIKRYKNTLNYGYVGTSTDYWVGYLNDTSESGWYGSISSEYKNMLVKGTYYLGTVGSGVSYKNAICSVSNTTKTTKECSKLSGSSVWTGYVGLPRVGEMFSAQLAIGRHRTCGEFVHQFF